MNGALKPMQRLFCEAYIVSGNAAESARRAGYSAQHSYRLLRQKNIREYISRRTKELIEERIQPQRVLLELERIAFSDVTHYAEVSEGRTVVKDTALWPVGASAAVEVVSEGVRGPEVRLLGKLKALELLGRATQALDGASVGEGGLPQRVVVEVVGAEEEDGDNVKSGEEPV